MKNSDPFIVGMLAGVGVLLGISVGLILGSIKGVNEQIGFINSNLELSGCLPHYQN